MEDADELLDIYKDFLDDYADDEPDLDSSDLTEFTQSTEQVARESNPSNDTYLQCGDTMPSSHSNNPTEDETIRPSTSQNKKSSFHAILQAAIAGEQDTQQQVSTSFDLMDDVYSLETEKEKQHHKELSALQRQISELQLENRKLRSDKDQLQNNLALLLVTAKKELATEQSVATHLRKEVIELSQQIAFTSKQSYMNQRQPTPRSRPSEGSNPKPRQNTAGNHSANFSEPPKLRSNSSGGDNQRTCNASSSYGIKSSRQLENRPYTSKEHHPHLYKADSFLQRYDAAHDRKKYDRRSSYKDNREYTAKPRVSGTGWSSKSLVDRAKSRLNKSPGSSSYSVVRTESDRNSRQDRREANRRAPTPDRNLANNQVVADPIADDTSNHKLNTKIEGLKKKLLKKIRKASKSPGGAKKKRLYEKQLAKLLAVKVELMAESGDDEYVADTGDSAQETAQEMSEAVAASSGADTDIEFLEETRKLADQKILSPAKAEKDTESPVLPFAYRQNHLLNEKDITADSRKELNFVSNLDDDPLANTAESESIEAMADSSSNEEPIKNRIKLQQPIRNSEHVKAEPISSEQLVKQESVTGDAFSAKCAGDHETMSQHIVSMKDASCDFVSADDLHNEKACPSNTVLSPDGSQEPPHHQPVGGNLTHQISYPSSSLVLHPSTAVSHAISGDCGQQDSKLDTTLAPQPAKSAQGNIRLPAVNTELAPQAFNTNLTAAPHPHNATTITKIEQVISTTQSDSATTGPVSEPQEKECDRTQLDSTQFTDEHKAVGTLSWIPEPLASPDMEEQPDIPPCFKEDTVSRCCPFDWRSCRRKDWSEKNISDRDASATKAAVKKKIKKTMSVTEIPLKTPTEQLPDPRPGIQASTSRSIPELIAVKYTCTKAEVIPQKSKSQCNKSTDGLAIQSSTTGNLIQANESGNVSNVVKSEPIVPQNTSASQDANTEPCILRDTNSSKMPATMAAMKTVPLSSNSSNANNLKCDMSSSCQTAADKSGTCLKMGQVTMTEAKNINSESRLATVTDSNAILRHAGVKRSLSGYRIPKKRRRVSAGDESVDVSHRLPAVNTQLRGESEAGDTKLCPEPRVDGSASMSALRTSEINESLRQADEITSPWVNDSSSCSSTTLRSPSPVGLKHEPDGPQPRETGEIRLEQSTSPDDLHISTVTAHYKATPTQQGGRESTITNDHDGVPEESELVGVQYEGSAFEEPSNKRVNEPLSDTDASATTDQKCLTVRTELMVNGNCAEWSGDEPDGLGGNNRSVSCSDVDNPSQRTDIPIVTKLSGEDMNDHHRKPTTAAEEQTTYPTDCMEAGATGTTDCLEVTVDTELESETGITDKMEEGELPSSESGDEAPDQTETAVSERAVRSGGRREKPSEGVPSSHKRAHRTSSSDTSSHYQSGHTKRHDQRHRTSRRSSNNETSTQTQRKSKGNSSGGSMTSHHSDHRDFSSRRTSHPHPHRSNHSSFTKSQGPNRPTPRTKPTKSDYSTSQARSNKSVYKLSRGRYTSPDRVSQFPNTVRSLTHDSDQRLSNVHERSHTSRSARPSSRARKTSMASSLHKKSRHESDDGVDIGRTCRSDVLLRRSGSRGKEERTRETRSLERHRVRR